MLYSNFDFLYTNFSCFEALRLKKNKGMNFPPPQIVSDWLVTNKPEGLCENELYSLAWYVMLVLVSQIFITS